MLTKDYLKQSGLTSFQLAEILGHKSPSSVTKKLEEEMPKRWVKLLDDRDGSSVVTDSDSERLTHDLPPSTENGEPDWEGAFRQAENEPRIPEDGETVLGPQRIKLTTVDGYIRQIYGGAAYIARNRGDEIAADVIERYTPEFSEAWIEYIKSDPRLLEYLEKMMIGTPIGNLIGVHVIAIGSYAFARAAATQIAKAAESEFVASNNGADDISPDHPMG